MAAKLDNSVDQLASLIKPHLTIMLKGWVLLALAQCMVAVNIVGTKYLISSTNILFILSARFLLASILLLGLNGLKPNKKERFRIADLQTKEWTFILLQAILAGVLFNGLMIWGLHYTDANQAGIIASVLPAIIAVLSFFILKERTSFKKSLCILLATAGLFVMNIDSKSSVSFSFSFGHLIILLALIPEAFYYILSKIYINKLPILMLSILMNSVNALILIPVLLLQINSFTIYFSWLNFFVLFIIGTSSGLFYVFWNKGISKVDSTMASLSTSIMPIATCLIAWLSLGEVINVIQIVGILFIIFSIIAYTKASWLQKKKLAL